MNDRKLFSQEEYQIILKRIYRKYTQMHESEKNKTVFEKEKVNMKKQSIPSAPKKVIEKEKIFVPDENWKAFQNSVKRTNYLCLFENLSIFTPEDKDVKSFIYSFISDYNYRFNTYIYNNKDNEIGAFHCYERRFRSFHDMWGLVKTYYKGTKFEDFVRVIFELSAEKKIKGKWLCGTIRKYVFTKAPSEQHPYERWEQYSLRHCHVLYNKPILIESIYKCLGFKLEDFLTEKK